MFFGIVVMINGLFLVGCMVLDDNDNCGVFIRDIKFLIFFRKFVIDFLSGICLIIGVVREIRLFIVFCLEKLLG